MGCIIDSLGLKQNRIKYTKDTINKLNIRVSQWNFVPSILQIELECGPRTITHIYDLLDQAKDNVPLKIALENISNYNVDETLYASESRRWAQLFYQTNIIHGTKYNSSKIAQMKNDNNTNKKNNKAKKKNKKNDCEGKKGTVNINNKI